MLSGAIGAGLLVSEGDYWRRQRLLMGPAFHQGELWSYGGDMAELARDAATSWHSGETRNVHEAMMALTLNIVAKLIFDRYHDLVPDGGLQRSALLRTLAPFAQLPTSRVWRIRRGLRRMDRIIYDILADLRALPHRTI